MINHCSLQHLVAESAYYLFDQIEFRAAKLHATNSRCKYKDRSTARARRPAMSSVVAPSALSSLEAMLHSMMGRSGGGGDETRIDDEQEVEKEEEDALESPPPLPVRPAARGRLPSMPRFTGAAGQSTPSSTPPPHKVPPHWPLIHFRISS
jgi:hypothetical protein